MAKFVLFSALAHFGFTFRDEITTLASTALLFTNDKIKEITNFDAQDHGEFRRVVRH